MGAVAAGFLKNFGDAVESTLAGHKVKAADIPSRSCSFVSHLSDRDSPHSSRPPSVAGLIGDTLQKVGGGITTVGGMLSVSNLNQFGHHVHQHQDQGPPKSSSSFTKGSVPGFVDHGIVVRPPMRSV